MCNVIGSFRLAIKIVLMLRITDLNCLLTSLSIHLVVANVQEAFYIMVEYVIGLWITLVSTAWMNKAVSIEESKCCFIAVW